MTMGRKRQNNQQLPARMIFTGRSYYWRPSQANSEGKRPWIRLARDYKEALIRYHKIELEELQAPDATFAAMVQIYFRDIIPTKAEKTQYEQKLQVKKLTAAFGKMAVNDIKPVHVAQYLDQRKSKVAANREIALMSAMYRRVAMRKGWADINPCDGIERHVEKARERYIEDWEFLAVRELASNQMGAIMDLAYLTAMRQGDLLALTIDQLTDEGIVLKQRKTGQRQLIEWSPALDQVVKRLRELRPKVAGFNLICNRRGNQYSPYGFRSIFVRLQQRAIKQSIIKERFTFHDIRAKGATDAADDGKNPQKLLGHRTAKQTQDYLRSRKTERSAPVK